MNKALIGLAGLGAYYALKNKKESEHEEDEEIEHEENPSRTERIFSDDEVDPEERRELRKIWRNWNRLVNMSAFELREFISTKEGREAGLSRKEAKERGIRSGRDSARALIKMIPRGRTFRSAMRNWSDSEWEWADQQVRFIKRMSAVPGDLHKKNGEKTRKHLALLTWGHDPRR